MSFPKAIAALSLLLPASELHAQQISGNELLETCTSEDQVLAGFCLGYIIGYSEGAPWGANVTLYNLDPGGSVSERNKQIGLFTGSCVPAEASNEQLRDVVLKHIIEHPETRHESARVLVWQAYIKAFPCD